MVTAPNPMMQQLSALLDPWYASVKEPETYQAGVLKKLLQIYAQTGYGRQHDADKVTGLEEYRRCFPVASYPDYKPLIARVMSGETDLLLNEQPIGWAITRGTTGDEHKFIPMTPTDLKMRISAGRAMMHYIANTGQFDILQGANLNLNFPSVVGKVTAGIRELEYGYSSGIYVKYVSASTPIRSIPAQVEIDALGGGKSAKDWEARFELAYQKCKDENVTMLGGVAPTAVQFGRYLHRAHKIYPKDIWKIRVMTLGSVPGTPFRLSAKS